MAKTGDDADAHVLQGTLDMLVLRTLQWGPQHGHGIGVAIASLSQEELQVDHGSLYPALHPPARRAAWLDRGRVEAVRQQAAREVLPADADRQEAAARRRVEVESPDRGD